MSSYGVTDDGFKRKRLDTILLELNGRVKAILGEDLNLSPESADGQIHGVLAESHANLWELIEEAYNSYNPSAATGVNLSNLVQINGIARLPATKSTVELFLTGNAGAVIPKGSMVSSQAVNLITRDSATLDSDGTAMVTGIATEVGPILISADSITTIDTPFNGWRTVNNPLEGKSGSFEETDTELRSRRELSVARNSQGIIDSLYAGIANVPGVTNLHVLENDTNTTNTNRLPRHSFQVVVQGGDDAEIAEQIWLKKPAGIQSYGGSDSNSRVTSQVIDSQGISHPIAFTRPTILDIHVRITLTKFADYPLGGDDAIKEAIINFDISNNNVIANNDVIRSRLYTPISTIPGHSVMGLEIAGSSGIITFSNNDIPISPFQVSRFLKSNIAIVTTP